jgi:hypothetical protein
MWLKFTVKFIVTILKGRPGGTNFFTWIGIIMLLSIVTEACNSPTPRPKATDSDLPVKIEPMLIDQLGYEHFGNAIYRRGTEGPRIAASGKRILEWPIQPNAPVREVVPPNPQDYNNGACALDINCDDIDEMIVARTGRSGLWQFLGRVSCQSVCRLLTGSPLQQLG